MRTRFTERRSWVVVASLVLGALVAACTEDYEGGVACPVLCPEQNVVVFDTTFDPVEFDTTVTDIPPNGTQTELLLAYRADSVDVRPVVRFDSLPIYFNSGGTDTLIQYVDSAYVKLRLNRSGSRVTAPVTIEVFDVDTLVGDSAEVANDTTTARERLLFRPDRLVGSVTLDTADIKDSIRVPIDSAPLRAKVVNQQRLRLGFRITSNEPVQLRIVSYEGGEPPVLRFLPHPDTVYNHVSVLARSVVPRSQVTLAADLSDYVHVFQFTPMPGGAYLTVGGLPSRRMFMRFNVPSRIIDSSNVLRATLILTQFPVRSVDDTVKLTVFPLLVTAGRQVTDIARSAFLTNTAGAGFDSVQFTPRDSGRKEIEIVNALRGWSIPIAKEAQRALVLKAGPEGVDPRFISFYSSRAAAELRPRLRVSYSPVRSFGIP